MLRVESPAHPLDLLTTAEFAKSRSEGRYLLRNNAVSLDGQHLTTEEPVAIPAGGAVLRVGKRRFLRVLPRK